MQRVLLIAVASQKASQELEAFRGLAAVRRPFGAGSLTA